MSKSSFFSGFLKKDILWVNRNILPLKTSSSEELNNILSDASKKFFKRPRYVSITTTSKDIVLCPFHFKNISSESIEDKVKFLAFELLNLPADQIAIDYQLFRLSQDEQYAGIMVCARKEQVEQYLKACDRHRVIPLRLAPYSLVSIDSFCGRLNIAAGRYCVIHFSRRGTLYLCILQNGGCETFRDIHYKDAQAAVRDIKQTLSSSTAMSKQKQFDQIYFFGDSDDKDEILDELKQRLSDPLKSESLDNMLASLTNPGGIFKLNLFKEYALSTRTRITIELALSCVFLFLGFMSFILSMQHMQLESQIEGVRLMYTATDYQKAQEIEKEIKSLNL